LRVIGRIEEPRAFGLETRCEEYVYESRMLLLEEKSEMCVLEGPSRPEEKVSISVMLFRNFHLILFLSQSDLICPVMPYSRLRELF